MMTDACVLQPHEVHDGTSKEKSHVQCTTQMVRSAVIMAEEKEQDPTGDHSETS
jgi:hypothetical protein